MSMPGSQYNNEKFTAASAPSSQTVAGGGAGIASTGGNGYQYQQQPTVPCPHCGYCPHCGRSSSYYGQPYYPSIGVTSGYVQTPGDGGYVEYK